MSCHRNPAGSINFQPCCIARTWSVGFFFVCQSYAYCLVGEDLFLMPECYGGCSIYARGCLASEVTLLMPAEL
jgi:hypothetical protein